MNKTFELADKFGYESPFELGTVLGEAKPFEIINKKRFIDEIKKAIDNGKKYFNPVKDKYTNWAKDKQLYPYNSEELKGIKYDKIKIIGYKLYENRIDNEQIRISFRNYRVGLQKLDPINELASYYISFPYKDNPKYKLLMLVDDTRTLEILQKALYLNKESIRISNEWKSAFFNHKDQVNTLDWLYLNAPIRIIKDLGTQKLLSDLVVLLSSTVDTYGTDEEAAVMRLLLAVYSHIEFSEIEDRKLGKQPKNYNDEFLNQLINSKFRVKAIIRDQQESNIQNLLQSLLFRLNGKNYIAFIQFIWNIWKESSYAKIDPDENPLINMSNVSQQPDTSGPILLDYRSETALGFHVDNAHITFNKEEKIKVDITVGTGVFEHTSGEILGVDGGTFTLSEEIKVDHTYLYHQFSPIAILNSENPAFIFKDNEQEAQKYSLLPAFVLLAHKEKAFWEDLVLGVEYAVDVLTTISGFGNILKVGRLAKLFKSGYSFAKKGSAVGKVYRTGKKIVGGIEITSGVGNILIKLSGQKDTELGRAISKYLFYLEMLALGGELTGFLETSIRNAAESMITQRYELYSILKANKHSSKDIEKILKETIKNAGLKTGDDILDEIISLRQKAFDSSVRAGNKAISKAVVNKSIAKNELSKLYNKRLKQHPNLKGFNQAEFKVKFIENGKIFDEVEEFSLSGDFDKLAKKFGNPPQLPENTIDILSMYDEYMKFSSGAFDLTGRSRKFDSEIKFIYNFIKNHYNKADEFIVETSNIFKTCSSCSREFALLQDIMKQNNKKLTIIVKSDKDVDGTKALLKKISK